MRYCLALDLVDDEKMIQTYEEHHKTGRPEIIESIKEAGVTNMELYRVFDRLFMIMETDNDFSFEEKDAMDRANPKVQEWESLMSTFQKPLPKAKPGEKWVLMKKIFQL
jgi:L-rhamnose mutarotase